ERYGDQADFANQKVLFTFGSTAGLPYYDRAIKEAGEFNWDVAMWPHETPEPFVNVYGPSAAIFKSVPERELAAWLFFKYWAEPENVAKWATVANYFPLRKSAMETETMKEYLKKSPKYAKAFTFLKYGRTEPNVAGYQQIRGIIADAMKKAIEGGEPKEILDEAVAEANAVLASQ
ncbi:MAG TPA: extracellular solute-binding protein, partial [Anaerolineae bacterium]|nr:extracellular solute-binding protein [Anaerolineae bacterium]